MCVCHMCILYLLTYLRISDVLLLQVDRESEPADEYHGWQSSHLPQASAPVCTFFLLMYSFFRYLHQISFVIKTAFMMAETRCSRPCGRVIRTFPPNTFPRTFPRPDNFPSAVCPLCVIDIIDLFTWCRTFPLPPPPSAAKRSTINVYRIDSGRSVKVKSTGQCQFSSFRFNSRMEWGGKFSGRGTVWGNMSEGKMSSGMSYTWSKLIAAYSHSLISFYELLSASLYVSKRGAYWDRLCRDVVGRWSVVGWLVVGRCTVAKRCILGL